MMERVEMEDDERKQFCAIRSRPFMLSRQTSVNVLDLDSDTRDSGISLGPGSRSCTPVLCSELLPSSHTDDAQNSGGPAHGEGDECCGTSTFIEVEDKENYDEFDSSTDLTVYADSGGPLKRRKIGCGGAKLPTDFSLLHVSMSLNREDILQEQEAPSLLESPTSSSIAIASNSSGSANISISNNTLTTLNSPLYNCRNVSGIPPAARSIQRVHSSSVLEYSRRSLGSPDTLEHYSLRTVERPQKQHRAYRSIGSETLANLLESMTEGQFLERFVLVDCRYPYEYEGGHIRHAINMYDLSSVEHLFYPEDECIFQKISNKIPIFYCEYSQKRGPAMALALRNHDRTRNEVSYPEIDYKEIYILDRGYNHFFKQQKFTKFCMPQAYVSMYDSAYKEHLKKFDSHRRQKKKRKK